MAVIELGDRTGIVESPSVFPKFPLKSVAAALAVVLLALLGGSAVRSAWPLPLTIPARLGDSMFVVGDRVYIVGATTLTSYSLPGATRLARITIPDLGTVMGLSPAGDTLLMSYVGSSGGATATVALDSDTGGELWRRPSALIASSGRDGIAVLEEDEGWAVVDVHTGAVNWQATSPPGGFLAPAGYDGSFSRWLVSLTPPGTLETRDARTGQIIARAAVPTRNNTVFWAVGDLAMSGGPQDGTTAYVLPGLTRAWHTDLDLSSMWAQNDCGPVICVFHQQRGLSVLDGTTGQLLWQTGRWTYAQRAGAALVTSGGEEGMTVLDARTGKVRGTFGPWLPLSDEADGELEYAIYIQPGTYRAMFGRIDAARMTVRLLAVGDDVSGDCRVSDDVAICRLADASYGVWRLGN